MPTHTYVVDLLWTGARGIGTTGYREYGRDFECRAGDKPVLCGSADPQFRGDPNRWNPEELLVASLSACHQLWYLHLCATSGVVVHRYEDSAEGRMEESADGGGEFVEVTLRPLVTITDESDPALAHALHAKAAQMCFIARSVGFPVLHEPEVRVGHGSAEPAKAGPVRESDAGRIGDAAP